jgi:hypothetical protein
VAALASVASRFQVINQRLSVLLISIILRPHGLWIRSYNGCASKSQRLQREPKRAAPEPEALVKPATCPVWCAAPPPRSHQPAALLSCLGGPLWVKCRLAEEAAVTAGVPPIPSGFAALQKSAASGQYLTSKYYEANLGRVGGRVSRHLSRDLLTVAPTRWPLGRSSAKSRLMAHNEFRPLRLRCASPFLP